MCHWQITLSNIDEICPSAIPNKISFKSMHVPSLVKIPWHLLKLPSGNENMSITPSKFDEICPLAIPNQISKISMHIPSLVKILWCLLKLSSGNEKRTDGRIGRLMDGPTDWHMDVQSETIIPGHYCVAGYEMIRHHITCGISLDKDIWLI